ncbi:YncE family protein [Methylocapsa palsarum]|uniref:DNA-binding beta-propeller fold protein YncE n=1 Tax=Methylocapsa palsarum TaxID=1612308 RepID=A0A1I4ADR8_9HYPH|nr:hypothetical protein [Methylocapsa palsarum]SFK54558.1 hypothetical protein SAMN05444581_11034 [Methylocapsa palsarum]
MLNLKPLASVLVALAALSAQEARCEILALLNYESKPTEAVRKEGIAIIDIDPASANFNKIIKDIPLPPDLVAHHIFYNPAVTKAYVTALGRSELRVFDPNSSLEAMSVVDVPDCQVGEDLAFSEDGETWYLTCMGSSNVVVGDARSDKVRSVIFAPASSQGPFIQNPHGIVLNEAIDRLIVANTIRPDLKDPGETITVIEASTQKILSTHKVSEKPSPSGAAPVEIAFTPRAGMQIAYITNMMGASLWTATWWPKSKNFTFQQVYDFSAEQQGVPLEMAFSDSGDRLYVTTAKPGNLDIFDIADPYHPRLIKAIAAAAGAHHVVFSADRRYAFVQNSLLNLPGMSDGSVSVIDLVGNEKIAEVDVLKKMGLNPNCIILLPKWRRGEG